MTYLLDANVFISAKNLHYGFDFCPAFWQWLIEQNNNSRVFSIEKVGDEVQALADELSKWAEDRGPKFFLRPGERMFPSLTAVSTWVSEQNYTQVAVSSFLQVADYYLVAHAHAHQCTVVTHEVSNPSSKRTIKIPDVCIGLGVKCVSPYEMLSKERARFVLGKPGGHA